MLRILNPNRRIWRKGESRFCEVRSIDITNAPIIRLTPRGMKELERRKRKEKKEQAQIERYNRRCGSGLWMWWLFGPFRSDGKSIFS